jgi:hypothetical protein
MVGPQLTSHTSSGRRVSQSTEKETPDIDDVINLEIQQLYEGEDYSAH